MKPRTGSVYFSDRYGKYIAKISATHPITKKIREWKRHADTSREAHEKLKEIQAAADDWIDAEAPSSVDPGSMSCEDLAKIFEKKSLIPARYINGVKVSGRRSLTSPTGWLANFKDYFGAKKLKSIRPSDIEDLKLHLIQKPTKRKVRQRAIASINRELEFCKRLFNFAVDEGYLKTNPFKISQKKIIEKRGETKRNRLPGFGEEFALLALCVENLEWLASPLIVAVDTGLRRNELLTLTVSDFDFKLGVIHLRRENAKSNEPRDIPMTARVKEHLSSLCADLEEDELIFDDFRTLRYYWNNLKEKAGVKNLTWHDLRHAFVSRSILAGIPPAVVLKASGHASEEWKRYLNTTPDQLRGLLAPLDGQTETEVKLYAAQVMKGLRGAMRYEELERIFDLLK
jgi:integrase